MDSRKTNSGETISSWMEIAPFFPQNRPKNMDCDICILGAGVAGLSIAYEFAKAGKSVVVLDQGPIAGGQTGRTSAHLTWMTDLRIYQYKDRLGEERTKKIIESHRAAIQWIKAVIQNEAISCDFLELDGYLFAGATADPEEIKKEYRALQDLGIADAELKNSVPNLFFDSRESLRLSNQAQFHPIKYMNGLARAIENYGGQIITECRVNEIQDKPAQVKVAGERIIRAEKIIVATNTPINDQFSIHTKQAPYRSYVVGGQIPKGSVPWSLYWDTEDPYHYVRVAPDETSSFYDILVIGGEDHKTGQDTHPRDRIENLKSWALARFPMIRSFKYEWSGQIWYTSDGLAFIGKNPGEENTYIVTGDSGQGITYAGIAAQMLPVLVRGETHPWEQLFDPSRLMFSRAREYLRENLNVAWQYADYLRPSEVESFNEIPVNEGAVVTRGLKKVAAYKNANGAVTELSAVCSHLGGIVHWNSVEKSWDCPCHGSRFSVDGQVITGPALTGLEPVNESEPYIPEAIRSTPDELQLS